MSCFIYFVYIYVIDYFSGFCDLENKSNWNVKEHAFIFCILKPVTCFNYLKFTKAAKYKFNLSNWKKNHFEKEHLPFSCIYYVYLIKVWLIKMLNCLGV